MSRLRAKIFDVTQLLLSPSYAVGRAAFLAASERAGASITSTPHPLRGIDDEQLFVDVADLGPADADTVVLVVSATHGAEGYCGSALQTHWLACHAATRPASTRIVHVHALNPFGMAWVRRVNEDNVDLNRNFVDWSRPPTNADYDAIAALVVPAQWTDEEQQRTTLELLALAERWGFARVQAVVSGGQYAHPTGVFYGGSGPVWSHRWLREFCATRLHSAGRAVVIDLHTGLGPWGVGELISSESKGGPHYDRAAALWGDITSMIDGGSVSAVLAGDWMAAVAELLPQAAVTPITIEFGTVDPITVLQALRADAWLHAHGDPRGAAAQKVRAQVRAAFADDDPAWIAACWTRFVDVMEAAITA